MRATLLATVLLVMPTLAFAGGEPLGSSSASSLYAPSYGIVGKAIGNRVTSMKPRGSLEPAGAIPAETDDLARIEREENKLLLERHLDCFSGAVQPDRDVRNSFLSRCPGNVR